MDEQARRSALREKLDAAYRPLEFGFDERLSVSEHATGEAAGPLEASDGATDIVTALRSLKMQIMPF